MAHYRYPDTNDRITSVYVQEAEPYVGYWAISEQRALDRVAKRLAGPARADIRALDAGCGDGRLLPWLAGLAGRITAVDADPHRLAAARERAATIADTEIGVLVGSIADLPDDTEDPYQLVVCSHVIQHIATTAVVPLLRRLHAVTAAGGQLLITFCRSPVGGEAYGTRALDNGRIIRQAMNRAQYDDLVANGMAAGELPVREIDPMPLAEAAHSAGWTQTWAWTYHVMDDLGVLDKHVDRDEMTNTSPALWRALGRDLMALWRRD